MNLPKIKVLIGYLLFSSLPIYSVQQVQPARNTKILDEIEMAAPITDYSIPGKGDKVLEDPQKLIPITGGIGGQERLGYILTSDLGFFKNIKEEHYITIGREFFQTENPYKIGTFDKEADQFIEHCFNSHTTKKEKALQSFILVGSFELKHKGEVLRILTFGQNMSSVGEPQKKDARNPDPGSAKFHAERVAIQKVHDLLLFIDGQKDGLNTRDEKLWKTKTRYDDVKVKFYGKAFNGLLINEGICHNCAKNLNRFFDNILNKYDEKDLKKHCLDPNF